MKTIFFILALITLRSALIAETPGTPVVIKSDRFGYTLTLPDGWKSLHSDARSGCSSESLEAKDQHDSIIFAFTGSERECSESLQRYFPPSVDSSPEFSKNDSAYIDGYIMGYFLRHKLDYKQTAEVNFRLANHNMHLMKGNVSGKNHKKMLHTEAVCGLLKHSLSCWILGTGDLKDFETFEHMLLSLDGEPAQTIVPQTPPAPSNPADNIQKTSPIAPKTEHSASTSCLAGSGDSSYLLIYRTKLSPGGNILAPILCDGEQVAATQKNEYALLKVSPGLHRLSTSPELAVHSSGSFGLVRNGITISASKGAIRFLEFRYTREDHGSPTILDMTKLPSLSLQGNSVTVTTPINNQKRNPDYYYIAGWDFASGTEKDFTTALAKFKLKPIAQKNVAAAQIAASQQWPFDDALLSSH